MLRRERKEKIEEIKKTLTPYEIKWFDSMLAEWPNGDLNDILSVVKERARVKEIQDARERERKEIYALEERRELCYYRYRNEHKCRDLDINKRLIDAFYTSLEPEKLMVLRPDEILKTCAV